MITYLSIFLPLLIINIYCIFFILKRLFGIGAFHTSNERMLFYIFERSEVGFIFFCLLVLLIALPPLVFFMYTFENLIKALSPLVFCVIYFIYLIINFKLVNLLRLRIRKNNRSSTYFNFSKKRRFTHFELKCMICLWFVTFLSIFVVYDLSFFYNLFSIYNWTNFFRQINNSESSL